MDICGVRFPNILLILALNCCLKLISALIFSKGDTKAKINVKKASIFENIKIFHYFCHLFLSPGHLKADVAYLRLFWMVSSMAVFKSNLLELIFGETIMKPQNLNKFITKNLLAALLACATLSPVFAANLDPLVDDFDDSTNNSLGIPRQLINDTVSGGNSSAQLTVAKGIMSVKGKIVPARGQPGWSSMVLPLDVKSMEEKGNQFNGIRLLIKINTGNISISANSSEITNFDYHAANVVVTSHGEFHEIKIPFSSMKRMWSEQTELNAAKINSLSIVSYNLQPGNFDFELDEVSFF